MKLKFIFILSVITLSGLFLTKEQWYAHFTHPAPNKLLVNIGRLICGGHLPLAIVEKKYYASLQSFQLNTIQNHHWDDVVANMQSGKLAGTFILSPLAMQLINEGFPGKIVLKADTNGNGFVLSHKIKTINDLKKQKTILAVPHLYSQHHVLLHMILQQHKISADIANIVSMPPRDMILSLQRGEIDGFVVGEPEGQRAISVNAGWMAAISPDIWPNHMDHVFMVTDNFIQQHPVQLQELINTLVKAGQFIEQNPHDAATMGEDYTGAPAAVFEYVLTTPPNWINYSDMIPSDTDINAMADKLVNMKLWSQRPTDMAKFTDTRFVEQAN